MQIAQVLVNGISYAASLALVAIGLTIVFGVLRVVNFAHGALFMLGAYATYYITASFKWNYFLAIIGAALVVGLISAFVAAALFSRYRGLLLEGAVMSIALALLITNLGWLEFSAVPRTVNSPIDDVINLGGVHILVHRLFIIVLTAVLLVALQFFVKRSRMGRAMRAVQQDPHAARLQGIKVDQVVVLTFAIGGVLAGIAGALVAPTQTLQPSMGEQPLLFAFVVIILGGMGSIPGAVLASLVLGLTESTTSTYWTPQAATWLSFSLVIVALAIRPKGLLGHE
jgi:branched-chain amino acid transport system permease protein